MLSSEGTAGTLEAAGAAPPGMHAIVVGGGIAGLTAARALLDAGWTVALYDKRSLEAMMSGPGGIQIQRNALRCMQLLSSAAPDTASLYAAVYQAGGRIINGGFASKAGRYLYYNTPRYINEDDIGVSCSRPRLQAVLAAALPPGVIRAGVGLVGFAEQPNGKVLVSLSNGSSTECDVLVGADGLHSRVRAGLASAERLPPPDYSGTTCWRGLLPLAAFPGGPEAYAALMKGDTWKEQWGRGHRFGWFQVRPDEVCWYAFSSEPPGGSDAAGGGPRAVLRRLYGDYARPVPDIIEAMPEDKVYRDDVFDRKPPGPVWGRGGVTLAGDAAHPVLPSLGQGGCIGIEDAFELAKALRPLAKQGSADAAAVAAALRRVEAERTPRVAQVYKVSREVHELGNAKGWFACQLRDWIYWLMPTWLGDKQFAWLFDYRPSWD